MKLILTLILILIMATSIWEGFKKGLFGGILGLLTIVVSLIIANIFASIFAAELEPALEPFLDGYLNSQEVRSSILESIGYGESDLSIADIVAEDSSLKYDYAYEANRILGIYSDASDELAVEALNLSKETETDITDAIVTTTCTSASKVVCLAIFFIMAMLLFTALFNIINLDIYLPNLEVFDEVSGAALGFIKGFLYCVLICWLVGFLGVIFGKNTADNTALVKFFLAFRFITNTLV